MKDVEPIMGGEDFAFFLQRIPGAMMFLGHYDENLDNGAALHNQHFMLHEGILARGAAYHAALATTFLHRGSLASQVQQECSNAAL